MLVLAICLFATLLSCQGTSTPPDFIGSRAFQLLQAQVDLGPRNPGSAGWEAFQIQLSGYLDSLGVGYVRQPFEYYDYLTGDTLFLVNWIARINPKTDRRILVAAHYDCRPRADYAADPTRRDEPIAGANDGASGVAVLMHLAELMVTSPPSIGVDLIFFDGEDYGPSGRIDQYLLGSAYFATHNIQSYQFGMLLDMIGDADLHIYRETFSNLHAREVNDLIWDAAARLSVGAFIDSVKHEILDDHLPLIAAGIPTVDIIDFEYPHWHTHQDTPDKCSAASLEAVGKVVLEVIYDQ
ncbi:MAG: M28 family peptidase [FCB group bacterium]|nr:M28 family peptidase [FCB group bacterium]